MRENRLRALWREGGIAANAWLALGDPFAAELVAGCGFDSVCVDLQHGLADPARLADFLRAIELAGAVALVRAPWNDAAALMRILDAGALGVIVPMIGSAADARAAVAACRYPPAGIRSHGPIRAARAHGGDYPTRAAEEVLVFAMIETRGALDDLDEILAVEGLSGLYVGPADLAYALGLEPRLDNDHPEHVAAVGRILDACRRHGKVAGLHTADPAFARAAAERGFQLLTVATDHSALVSEVTRRLRAFRDGA
ncbi:MAG TPA: aldolase/citrate lyase family protein [Trueperaceae bacterium]|nr:aldolase/citrate lyase family protein [Trueperaceae bacterium]